MSESEDESLAHAASSAQRLQAESAAPSWFCTGLRWPTPGGSTTSPPCSRLARPNGQVLVGREAIAQAYRERSAQRTTVRLPEGWRIAERPAVFDLHSPEQ